MGGGLVKMCDGKIVFDALDAVFLDPTKQIYQDAQKQKHLFKQVNGDPQKLYDAYMAVGVKDPPGSLWLRYLKSLSSADIDQIASARFDGLNPAKGKPFPTPQHHDPGVDPHVKRSKPTDPTMIIDVPFNPNDDCP
jgi:hypothetical protein